MSRAMWENAAGGLIASEVHGVIGLLVSRIKEEIQLAWGLEEELEKVKEQFEVLSGILEGASRQPVLNPVMAGWLKKIKNVAEDVDILLDECSYKALEDKIQTQQWDSVVNTLIKPFDHFGIAHKAKDLEELIDDIYKHADKLGIKLVKVAGGEVYSGTLTQEIERQDKKLSEQRQSVDLQLFRGRDYDVQKLVELLCDPINSNSYLTVIGVVGLAGLGKTTLIKHVSKVQGVKDFFDSRIIWLVVSHNFDLMDILNEMVEILFGEASKMSYRQALIEKLETNMRGRKYLIIMDDVWDTIEWESLKSTLHEIGVSKGTTLLVTSRDKHVVKKLNTPKNPTIYKLQELSSDESWSLFMAKFHDGIVAGSENEKIVKRMIDKCGGVPLAIRVLADLLRGKKRIQEWREIEESEIWTTEDENGILPSLRLSYNYLPHIALKKCFAYCAIFKEDEVIKKQELIYMWMAQGLLHPNDKMELKGEEYIEHLLSSSLFQDAQLDRYGNVNTFKMHDLVRSLAGVVSMGECLCSNGDDEDLDKVRHLLVPCYSGSRKLTFSSSNILQTCIFSQKIKNPSLNIWSKCERLRVLVIGSNWSENTEWKPLGRLIHLRYFEITACTNYLEHFNLPDQITKLYHLQTLIINIPSVTFPPGSPKNFFPKGLGNLVKLRHIVVKDSKIGIPMGLSHLTALQTLPIVNLGLYWRGRISELGLLSNLSGKLEIHDLKLLTIEEARSLDLASKSNLDSLVLKWIDHNHYLRYLRPKKNEILEALQPNENLRKFELWMFNGTAFPKWLVGPDSPLNKIVSLHIDRCEEAYGNLKVENFICLRILKVQDCERLTVTFSSNRSQCCKHLEELHIVNCNRVEELPELLLMPKLQVINISANTYSRSKDGVLVGLGNLPYLRQLRTDLKLPLDLGEDSPVCKSLEDLTLNGSKYDGDTVDLPEQLQHLVALQSLAIRHFESVEAISNWLGKLTSLKTLFLSDMPKLKQLPPIDVMQNLSNLALLDCHLGCPILEEDVKNRSGEWLKISHIPDIRPE